jgi:hypothetical protein
MERMTHFTAWEWTDFVTETGDPAAHSAMHAHLAGCARCQRTVDVLRTVADLAQRESAYAPPDHAIRYARALYSLYRPEKSGLTRLIAQLMHDSASAPLPAGIRSEDRLSRHLVYQAENYYLDLQLEYQPSGRVTLIGQLANQSAPAISTANVPVCLMERSTTLATTLCNTLGEFHLECAPSRNLRLHLPLPTAGKQLEVPLSDLDPDSRIPLRPTKVVRPRARRPPDGR